MTLAEINDLHPAQAEAAFLRCCGSRRWAGAMAEARPFDSLETMIAAGDACWAALTPDDWLEAFAAHPQIGEQKPVSAWSSEEQAGAASAAAGERTRLAALNAAYRTRFGYIFIVCATGRSAAEMLTMLETRLSNDPALELRIAADEQRQITGLRLVKLMGDA
jgi:OHCU decarboxylase